MKTASLCAVVISIGFAAVLPTVAEACAKFGADQRTIDKVQSSWAPGEKLMHGHQYHRALATFRSTERYLTLIHDRFIRKCVAEGADIRVVSAQAGAVYLDQHSGDVRGAQSAADRAWRAFPMRHDCP